MYIKDDYFINKNKKGEIWLNITPHQTWEMPKNIEALKIAKQLLTECRKHTKDYLMIDKLIQNYLDSRDLVIEAKSEEEIQIQTKLGNEQNKANTILLEQIDKLIKFFSEFQFEPNFRFLNTLARCSQQSHKQATDYVYNYFSLTDNQNTAIICDKMNSTEFEMILQALDTAVITKNINSRFEIYYGSQGTGKTTEAIQKSKDVMVCHSAMLPSDLMEDFTFEDGKATFKPSALYNAMIYGEIITLDEINLLPFESLRFLQSILDGKKEFTYKGQTIEIKDGFKIIGTMNLQVNGAIFSLPEPLVDRASILKKYTLTANQLLGAF